MLSLKNITRHYSGADSPAVSNVSLEVKRGETLALVGESGSGKTTLLRLIAGLETPDGGEVTIDGKLVADTKGTTWVPAEKREVGFVFQDGALFPHLTAAENVGYGLSRKTRDTNADTVNNMLETVGLDGFQKRFLHQLSGGERQRLAVARALAPHPKLILLDEPFSNLDPALRRSLREEIQNILTKVSATAIMVTHDTDDALAVGDRIAVFRNADIEQIGSPAELYTQPKNGYCARLFGPANFVALNGSGPIWVRPENMRISLENTDDNAIPVHIHQTREVGRHVEAIVECLDSAVSNNESWTIFVTGKMTLRDGKKAWISLEK